MTTFRRRLRFWVAAWLVFQATSLSALVPRACCLVHQPAADTNPKCHEDAGAAHSSMSASDGVPCPMHRTGHHDHEAKPADGMCSMRAACDGAMSALSAFLSSGGVLPDSRVMSPVFQSSAVTTRTRENLITRLTSPDPPPPRG